jgi:hypothetical protein
MFPNVMNIQPIDSANNLFSIADVVPDDLVKQIVATDWMSLEYTKEQLQKTWPRRRIKDSAIPWIDQWHTHLRSIWDQIIHSTQSDPPVQYLGYTGTAWWVDKPGFDCAMHTDGELPGAMQLYWIGNANQGTTFYHSNNVKDLRHRFELVPNSGYIMIRDPQWHAMLKPVQPNQLRVTSYSWIVPYE